MIEISALKSPINNQLAITGSKSESNRLLLLSQLFENVLTLENVSNSEDSQLMQKALANKTDLVDIIWYFIYSIFFMEENNLIVVFVSY